MIIWARILVCARFLALRRALGFLSPCQCRVLTKFCTFTAVMVSHGNMQLATLQLLALLQEMVKLLPVSPRSKEEDHKKKVLYTRLLDVTRSRFFVKIKFLMMMMITMFRPYWNIGPSSFHSNKRLRRRNQREGYVHFHSTIRMDSTFTCSGTCDPFTPLRSSPFFLSPLPS